MTRVRVKICGITRHQDALDAAAAGADAIGLVFFHASPRALTPEQAAEIVAGLPPFLCRVGLFVDAEESTVRPVLEAVSLDLLQFHGNEPPEFCNAWKMPYIKAVRMRQGIDLADLEQRYADAAALLLDTHVEGRPGGTGRSFDWGLIPRNPGKPVILAGGLAPGNVEQAIRQVRPFAIDVSGGVESAPGIKDPSRIAALMEAVARSATP